VSQLSTVCCAVCDAHAVQEGASASHDGGSEAQLADQRLQVARVDALCIACGLQQLDQLIAAVWCDGYRAFERVEDVADVLQSVSRAQRLVGVAVEAEPA
jgi:hypothetical protein